MNKKMTWTDGLLLGAIGVSLLATLLHTTLPAVLYTVVHIAVTGLVSVVHLSKKASVAEPRGR